MNVQIEIATTKCWMLRPSYLRLFRRRYEESQISFEDEEKVICKIISATTGKELGEDYLMSDGEGGQPATEQRDKFVSLLMVDGPVTRNGGACLYGSRELRDKLMDNARHPDCIGHIFYINTPGGSAWAKNDFQQAIDYAHSKNQPVIAYIDGMCCSAGMYLAALCDERYYMHPKNEIGCIGVMAAFYTEKDGEKNEATGETYHELYDPESFDKNREMRDIANDNDTKLLVEELAKLGVEFRADVQKACPKATDEHLHGKVFAAKEVEGILMDGQKTLQEVFNRIVEISPAAKEPAQQARRNARMTATEPTAQVSTTLNSINMKEKFPKIFALLGVEAMECKEDGTFFNASLLETLEGKIGEMEQANADAKALAEQLTNEKNELTTKVESLTTEHAAAIEQLNAEHTAVLAAKDEELKEAIAGKDTTIASLNEAIEGYKEAIAVNEENMDKLQKNFDAQTEEINGAKAAVETAEQTLAERDQTISDLNAQIAELENDPGEQPQAGAAPQTNGQGAEAPKVVTNIRTTERGKTYEEMRQDWGDYDK